MPKKLDTAYRKFQLVKYILVISLFYFVLAKPFVFAQSHISFKQITISDGLPHSDVTSIAQDKLGFMWFGTYNGLCRYDGYTFDIYKYNKKDINGINNNRILSLSASKNGNLWVGTETGGLNLYDYNTGHFKAYKFLENDTTSISHNTVRSVFEDSYSTIWAGTDNGLCRLNTETNRFERFLKNLVILSIVEDANNTLWIASNRGLIKFNMHSFAYKIIHENERYAQINTVFMDASSRIWVACRDGVYIFDPGYEIFTKISSNLVYSIFQDKYENIWLGTQGEGLIKYNPRDKTFISLKDNNLTTNSHNINEVKAITQDKSGNMWFGTLGGGISKYNQSSKSVHAYKNIPGNPNSLKTDAVICFFEDEQHRFWVATRGNGINILDEKRNKWIIVENNKNGVSGFDNLYPSAFYLDKNGSLWIGTWNGIYIIDKQNRANLIKGLPAKFEKMFEHEVLGLIGIYKIIEDDNGFIWISSSIGLWLFKPGNNYYNGEIKQFTYSNTNENSISDNFLTDIYFEKSPANKDNILWIGTRNGLNKLVYNESPSNSVISRLPEPASNSKWQNNSFISFIHRGKNGNLWVGTLGDGLYQLDNERFTGNSISPVNYVMEGEPGNNEFESLLEDEKGNFWIGGQGLIKFTPSTKKFNLYINDDLKANSLKIWAALKLKTGEMMFGGTNGFIVFSPDSIFDNLTAPKPVIRSLYVLNKTVNPWDTIGGNVILTNAIEKTKSIELSYNLNNISLEFTALHYEYPEGNKYKYKLDKVDGDWIEVKGRRFVNYSNLEPGKYLFRLKAANCDGIWSEEETTLQIIVAPPFWKTIYAYIFYVALLAVFLLFYRKYSIIRVVEKNNLKMERLKRTQEEMMTKMKLEFFTNIAHEIRTPLSLIVDPAEELKSSENLAPKAQKLTTLIHNNTIRLMKLVDQIMEFSKYEQGKMKIQASENDFVEFCAEIVLFFNYAAKSRNIELVFINLKDNLNVWFDKEKMESVLFNLINNALKYTPNNGKIIISCDANETSLILSVSDTGIGIADKNIPYLFERFYQTSSFSAKKTGVGIGLALVKMIVEQHRGNIEVESELNKGTKFTVFIPLGNKHLTKEQLDTEGKIQLDLSGQIITEEISDDLTVVSKPEGYSTKNKTILIVEDNFELRDYLKQKLVEEFNVVEASNGKEAFDYVINNEVDIVLSDIMMPVMDGIEFCNKLKTNIATSHVPIMLLTARTSMVHRLQSYESGADAYIQKPFNIKIVKARIFNLLKSREILRQKFKTKLDIEPSEITFTTYDEKLLKKIVAVIEQNISDSEFGVNELSTEVGVSRPQLYRKIKALTDLSISDFIRSIRLKRAAQILAKDNSSVTEVMYMTGFSNKSYFARAFKDQFGVSPKNYTSNSSNG